MHATIPYQASEDEKSKHYAYVMEKISALLDQENDWISAMATVVCELHHGFDYFHWTGFYRVVQPEVLKIGPYQGSHGCLVIPFSKGVCGAAARTNETQLVDDVEAFPGHIACAASTKSEIVVPISDHKGSVVAVLDVDSDFNAAFTQEDKAQLERLASQLTEKFFKHS